VANEPRGGRQGCGRGIQGMSASRHALMPALFCSFITSMAWGGSCGLGTSPCVGESLASRRADMVRYLQAVGSVGVL
jgi:hypothetical protein